MDGYGEIATEHIILTLYRIDIALLQYKPTDILIIKYINK